MAVSPFYDFFIILINNVTANNLPTSEGEPKYWIRPFRTRN
jgi:hypothetical protein